MHYPDDVLAGALLGTAAAVLVCLVAARACGAARASLARLTVKPWGSMLPQAIDGAIADLFRRHDGRRGTGVPAGAEVERSVLELMSAA